jgi:DNA-binding NarL/FixJ family response regulator
VTIRILIADHHMVFRAGLRSLLGPVPDLEVVAEAGVGHDALTQARRLLPNVVIASMNLPGVAELGLACKLLTIEAEPPRLVALVTGESDDDAMFALTYGASAVLRRDSPIEYFVSAIRCIVRGHSFIPHPALRRLVESVTAGGKRATGQDTLTGLTDRELTVLQFIGTGLSNTEIAARLCLRETTVKTHVRHLFDKLAVRNRVEAALYAHRAGVADIIHSDDLPISQSEYRRHRPDG